VPEAPTADPRDPRRNGLRWPAAAHCQPRGSELDTEDCRLDRIDSRIDADAGTDIALAPTVFANFTQRCGEGGIVRDDHTAVAKRTEVLCRVKTKARNVAERSRGPSAVHRAVALRAILDQTQAVPARHLGKCRQFGWLAIDVHR